MYHGWRNIKLPVSWAPENHSATLLPPIRPPADPPPPHPRPLPYPHPTPKMQSVVVMSLLVRVIHWQPPLVHSFPPFLHNRPRFCTPTDPQTQILVVMGLLVRVIHWQPALAGLAATLALIPLTMVVGKALANVRRRLVGFTDARVKLCTEVITGGWVGA